MIDDLTKEEKAEIVKAVLDHGTKVYRIVFAMNERCHSLKEAKEVAENLADNIWNEFCGIKDPVPRVLDVYEVKE